MSEDLPIKISLSPDAAVAGAKAVTTEVAKTEAQADKAKAAFEALSKSFSAVGDAMKQQTATALTNTAKGFDSLTEAIRREQAVLDRIHGPAKQYEQDLKTLDSMHARGKLSTKEYADEVARLNKQLDGTKPGGGGNGQLDSIAKNVKSIDFKQAAGAAAQAFELVNQKLKITDSEFGAVAGSAIKFGAMGAQVAGPWGAAAGAVVGALLEIDGVMDDVGETAKRLADASKTAAERFAELTKDSTSFKGQLEALAAGSHTLSEALVLVTRHLQNLHDATATFASLGPVLKAVNDQLAAQKKILGDINDPAANFVLSMTALNMLFKNGKISAVDYVEQQSKMAVGFATQEGVVVKATKALKDYSDVLALLRSASNPAGPKSSSFSTSKGGQAYDAYVNAEVDRLSSVTAEPNLEADLAQQAAQKKAAEDHNRLIVERAELTRKWKAELEATDTVARAMEDSLKSSVASFSDTLVDAANGAQVSWGSFFKGLLVDMEKAILKAALLKVIGSSGVGGAAGTGIIGALGFASGGTIWPSGGGTADTQSVSFRKRPDETVHINTPQQEQAYQRGGQGGGGRTQTVNVQADDSRALMQNFDGPDGDRVVLNVMRRNPGAVRALLGR